MKAKKYMIIGIFILMIALVGSVGTYAWFTWKSTSNTSLTMSIGKLADVIFTSGNDISTSTLAPVFNYTDGELTTFSINNRDTSGTIINYGVKLNITSIATELKSTSLKYVLLKNNIKVKEGDFSTISTGSTTIYSDSISTSGITNYKFYLYIDGNIENNTSMINKTLSGTLTVTEITDTYELTNGDGTTYTPSYNGSGTKIARSNAPLNKFKEVRVDNAVVDSSNYTLTEGSTIITFKETYLQSLSVGEHILKIISTDGFTSGKITVEKPTLAKKITNLYTNATKTPVINNSITYQYDTTHSLMKDVGNNIRYYGASPNNYIYFNCSDYSNQSSSTCETWRIIGVFDGKVKIMRNEVIGDYSWNSLADSSTSSTSLSNNNETKNTVDLLINKGNAYKSIFLASLLPPGADESNNNWNQASLMKLLNPGYESKTIGGSLYYNSGSGSCYSDSNNATTTCDFTSTGIKNDTTRNLILDTLYYLGGWNSSSVYSDQFYGYERGTTVYSGRPTTWTGKIALPYPSDYGYAADLGSCTQPLNNYNDSTCTSTNWMENIITNNGNHFGWLLTPLSSSPYLGYSISLIGNVNNSEKFNCYAFGVAPVLYLGSELSIKSGTGSGSDPYQLSV